MRLFRGVWFAGPTGGGREYQVSGRFARTLVPPEVLPYRRAKE